MTFTEPVEQWLQALESGEYKQAPGALAVVRPGSGKRYCCLGVACELYAQEHPEVDLVISAPRDGYVTFETRNARVDAELLPEVVSWLRTRDAAGAIDWAQVPEDDPGRHYQRPTLARMNDNGMTFADIAAFIRRNPTAVFKESK